MAPPTTQARFPRWWQFMQSLRPLLFAPLIMLASAATAAAANFSVDPMRFFVGRTETVGQVKIMFHKGYATHSTGQGRIQPDGSLLLVQQVFDAGKPPHERRWHVRQTGPGRYAGTMTDAVGPVTIERIGNRYRFRFQMDGRLSVEQLLIPLAGGRAASSSVRIRKFGMVVATTDGFIRQIAVN
jgi:hypothetical protein